MTPTLPQPVYFELPETATYARRRVGWFAAPPGAVRLGTLRLVMYPYRLSGDGVEADVYAVGEDDAFPMPDVRVFLLVNETDETQEQPYSVTCVRGRAVECTCPAGRAKLHHCKHADSVERLLADGLL